MRVTWAPRRLRERRCRSRRCPRAPGSRSRPSPRSKGLSPGGGPSHQPVAAPQTADGTVPWRGQSLHLRHNVSMRCETVIATHTNTDFDAFAAMLAARRLYPGSLVCLAGSLNRNVREFYRLHADELDFVVEASRLELDAIRRLIVVETVHAGR